MAISAAAAGLITAGASVLNAGASTAYNAAASKKQREWSEKMTAQQNEWNLNMWNKTNEYNSPEQQVQRLRDAGLNPLYYGLDGSSANGLESAQPLGYERANMSNIENSAVAGLNAYMAQKSLDKEIELKNAEIDKIKADTSGVTLDNEFKDMTLEIRAESERLSNEIDRATIRKINAERGKIAEEVKKVIAETENEQAKKLLTEAQTNLADMEAREIAALLPYKQLLIVAQTEAQKASAAANFAQAAMNNGLLEAGYVDSYIDNMAADYRVKMSSAERNEYDAAITEFKSNVRNGKAIDLSKYEGKPVGKALARFMNATYQDLAILGEAIGGVQGLAGVAVGAALKGNNVNVSPSASNPTTHGKSTLLYGADGSPSVTSSW